MLNISIIDIKEIPKKEERMIIFLEMLFYMDKVIET